jgi:cytochrome c553
MTRVARLIGLAAAASFSCAALAQASAPAATVAPPATAAPAAPAAPAGPARPDPAKGGTIATSVCAACHATDGSRGTAANPIIAGQHPDYLVKQLAEFKAGRRKSPIMQPIAGALSDADMRDVAAFYGSKQAKPGFAKNKEMASLGETIWRAGIADKTVPACSGCHGPNGAGIPAQYPRLGGQHAEYVEGQLVAFRSAVRQNNLVMSDIAAKLNDREIKALADYASGLR